MGRPSKLSDRQWDRVGARLAGGETTTALAKEYGVSKAAVSKRLSERTKQVQAAAGLLVQTETAMQKLTVSEQVTAQSLANGLMAISASLIHAAVSGAATAQHLSGIAHKAALQILEVPTDEDAMQALKGVAALTRTANEASGIGIDLLKANRDALASSLKPGAAESLTVQFIAAPDDFERIARKVASEV